ncbi:unnamed protein product [Haemonchus placei]|uniref:EB domain-containing protein n=1 Tax=Haemonchus placei TaxID=6290 RepID=A0A158QRQ2_HAEPC|nr:unnamed protein product [Haemonchus placei]
MRKVNVKSQAPMPMAVENLRLRRCQCSSEAGGVRCYNGWCDVQDFGGKVGACALVRVGTRQHFACVRVKPTSEDSCKVEQRNGETLFGLGRLNNRPKESQHGTLRDPMPHMKRPRASIVVTFSVGSTIRPGRFDACAWQTIRKRCRQRTS